VLRDQEDQLALKVQPEIEALKDQEEQRVRKELQEELVQ
jgi:hypothetical protein